MTMKREGKETPEITAVELRFIREVGEYRV
jgi:hypothetical protein